MLAIAGAVNVIYGIGAIDRSKFFVTDAEYVISDLPEGEYTVVASGYPPATSHVSLVGGDEAAHDVRLGYEQLPDELAARS